jgi:hypothetical protein
VFPLDWSASRIRPGQRERLARGERSRQLQIIVEVAARRPWAAFCAARLVRHYRSGRQQQSRGVSDHPKWAIRLPSLRPAMWSLTPPLKGCWRPVPAPSVRWKPAVIWTDNLRGTRWISRCSFTLVPAFGFERLTPRGGPRQRAVVGAPREREVVSRNRWSMNRCPRARLSQVSRRRLLTSSEAEQYARRSVPRTNPLRRRH